MSHNRFIQTIAVVLALACFGGAALVSGPINRQRVKLSLAGYGSAQNVPPRIALTQAALGSFRGLLVDLLWFRANKLKEEGQYREANQLSELICTLQPRFDKVWQFHAWNMAYNISVATHTDEERWNWVNKGIRLLRGPGNDANPDSVLIKKELAWIFFHKLGGVSDDMHWYYRAKLAREWQEVLGVPEGFTEKEMLDRIRDIVEAPDTLEAMLEHEPTRKLVGRLRELGYSPDEELLREFGRIFMFMVSPDRVIFGVDERAMSQIVDLKLFELMRDPDQQEAAEAYRRLVNHLRKRVIIDRYRMDPAEMLRLMELYGPIDWRHPAAHGCYWATQAIKSAERARLKASIDQINTDRLIIHSLQELMSSGRLTYDPMTDYLHMLPDPRFIDAYETAMYAARERVEGGEYGEGTIDNYATGHDNFLFQAVTFCYLYGDREQANHYFQKWRELYGDEQRHQGKKSLTLIQFVLEQIKSETRMLMPNTQQFIDAMLRNAFIQGLAQGRQDVFETFFNLAKELYDDHQRTKGREYNPHTTRGRMQLEPWPQLVPRTYYQILVDRRLPLVERSRVWRLSPLELRRVVYDQVRPTIYDEAVSQGLNPDLLLAEPPYMDEFRRRRDEALEQQEKKQQPPGTVMQQ